MFAWRSLAKTELIKDSTATKGPADAVAPQSMSPCSSLNLETEEAEFSSLKSNISTPPVNM